MGGYSVATLQSITILISYITLDGYSAMTLQPRPILASYGTLGGYNIKFLQPIVISTAYSILRTLQRKASTTNRHSSSLEHSWGDIARSHYNQYRFSKVCNALGWYSAKPLKLTSLSIHNGTLSQIVRKTYNSLDFHAVFWWTLW